MSTLNFYRNPILGDKANRVLLGLTRVIHGAGVAAIAAFGVTVFTWIPGAEGYIAVLYFLGAVFLVVCSGYLVWRLGGKK